MTDERVAALRDELTLRECGIDVPERHGSPVPVAAERHDPAERLSLHREVLYVLLHLKAVEMVGMPYRDQDARWERAFEHAAEVYGEEG